MRLYNTLARKTETFAPQEQPITVYACGITPYDTAHLGHAFTYTTVDVLIRYLEFQGHNVRYVQNVTDIDNAMLREAEKVGRHWKALGNRWTIYFVLDMWTLNVRPPDRFPRATDSIPRIIAEVERLLEAGVAYRANGSVYFHLDACAEYGKLSRLSRGQMLPIANVRGNNPDDPHKQDPLDFVLWQAQVPGEPAWDSPWGAGRPGRHIGCSAMATHYLGDTVDIHCGDGDLVFPHHESEIAQAECATGQEPFARFWLHTAMVRIKGQEMGKALDDLVTVRDLLHTWSPDALRLYLGQHHYREAWSHDPRELEQAERLAQKLRAAVAAPTGTGMPLGPSPARADFTEAMDEDLCTPRALAALEQLGDEVLEAAAADRDVQPAQEALRSMGLVFGLRLDTRGPEERVVSGWNQHLKRFSGYT
jgi:L-cysteine:1D-myo-inositol 2-amino-2-deoxy-alpha-D-glucopyranoside ligase